MRLKIVAANWKMNTRIEEGIILAQKINNFVETYPLEGKRIVLCVPFTHITEAIKVVNYKYISIGAQNCAQWEKGAYTGEVSAEMIASTGAHYVIIGHSERRKYFGESDEVLKNKVNISLKNALRPIFCVGETLEEREKSLQYKVVKAQIENALFHLDEDFLLKVVIAYEPVWAIGTGVNATPEQAQEMHAYIRNVISEKYSEYIADSITILYGGSCNSTNAKDLFSQKDVDGGLIGGASLKADEFIEIIKCL
ncbi:MAG: triose-phosphate isomerase [Bacteroidales bacterium]|nr:triose-phosphate isomerase [Bacteroidales bacterium]